MTKLIIWDLDGVLWPGSLTEGGDIHIPNKILNFIQDTEENGVIHSICSKNNFNVAKKHLETFGIWDLFVFPSIDLTPKGNRIKQIIQLCQLRNMDVVFIDDNIINLNEAVFYSPRLNVSNDVKQFINDFVMPNSQSRTLQYKILESKTKAKQLYTDDDAFLKDSDIQIAIAEMIECLPYHNRIEELVNRSNQLNYTRSRFDVNANIDNNYVYKQGYKHIQGSAISYLMRNSVKSYAVFAWDKYGYYGLVGFIAVDSRLKIDANKTNKCIEGTLSTFVFSCRIMNMKIEQKCIQWLKNQYNVFNYDFHMKDSTDFITVHAYKEVKKFILENENITNNNNNQILLLSHCTGPIYAAYSKYIHNIETEIHYEIPDSEMFRTERLFFNECSIDEFPKYIIFGAYFEFVFNYSMYWNKSNDMSKDYFAKVIGNFVSKICNSNRKLLVLLPSYSDEYKQDIRYDYLWYAWEENIKKYKIDVIYFPKETNYEDLHPINLTKISEIPGLRKYSRNSMFKVSQEIDIWLDRVLSE